MQKTLTLYHGSNHIIEKPLFNYGKIYNDYGLGFYCTKSKDLAKEWAAQENQDGFINEYTLSFSDTELSILNLNINCKYPVLNWLYVLTQNRTINDNSQLMNTSIQYLKDNFAVDYKKYDILIGYRADDSYFQFARDFLAGTIPYSTLSRAMKLGKLGNQIVLKSKKAFEKIQFVSSEKVISKEWFPKRKNRENEARNSYQKSKTLPITEKDFFITDIIRGRITDADKRILRQRVSTSRTREFGLDV